MGNVRRSNQDAILTGPALFAVADGMGGHAAGEVASALAIATLSGLPDDAGCDAVVAAISTANHRILAEATEEAGRAGMGTTLVGGVFFADGDATNCTIFNVGDSRAYRLSSGRLQQVSNDHSYVADLLRAGSIDEAEARSHPARNVVTRVLGSEGSVVVDRWDLVAEPGDRYLFCSDGLTNEVMDSELAEVLCSVQVPQQAVDELVLRALSRAANDNISLIVVDISAGSGEQASADDTNPRHGLITGIPVASDEAPPITPEILER